MASSAAEQVPVKEGGKEAEAPAAEVADGWTKWKNGRTGAGRKAAWCLADHPELWDKWGLKSGMENNKRIQELRKQSRNEIVKLPNAINTARRFRCVGCNRIPFPWLGRDNPINCPDGVIMCAEGHPICNECYVDFSRCPCDYKMDAIFDDGLSESDSDSEEDEPAKKPEKSANVSGDSKKASGKVNEKVEAAKAPANELEDKADEQTTLQIPSITRFQVGSMSNWGQVRLCQAEVHPKPPEAPKQPVEPQPTQETPPEKEKKAPNRCGFLGSMIMETEFACENYYNFCPYRGKGLALRDHQTECPHKPKPAAGSLKKDTGTAKKPEVQVASGTKKTEKVDEDEEDDAKILKVTHQDLIAYTNELLRKLVPNRDQV